MSLLPKGAARSDTALNVYGCAICHFGPAREPELAAAVAAAFHIRLPGSSGAQLGVLLQQLLASSKFQRDIISKTRMTVDDASTGITFSIHCMLSDGLCIIACTKQDYTTRVVFPSTGKAGMLGELAALAADELGSEVFTTGSGMGGTVRKVQLAPRMTQKLERVCSEFEDPGGHDKIARVQREVDDVRGVMQDNIQGLLANQDQLTSLQGKTDDIANASRGFYREARTTRRTIQCEDAKIKLIIGAVGLILFLFLFRGWIWGGDDESAPSPPPPEA
mmetsp:Transcript_22692/g.57777  ORF Transcript_22692/g.57777 Transcript_22692/m.57777 type:complete len:277 (-) Transcript_22692:679-1509(-)